ncbi:MAG: serine/threonine-protein kinase, partial [Planctomycetota bacterium]
MSSSERLAVLDVPGRNKLEAQLMEFDSSWQPEALDEFVARIDSSEDPQFGAVLLAELVRIDLQRSWQSGCGRSLEDYLEKYASLGDRETVPTDLIVAEFEARQVSEAGAEIASYEVRFPKQFSGFRRAVQDRVDSQPGTDSQPGANATPQASIDTSRLDEVRDTKSIPKTVESGGLPPEFGRYRIVKELGAGAMGMVYLAVDTQLDRKVALKTPSFVGHDHEELVARFYREARSAAKLQHRNICQIYDVGEIDGRHFISMAFVKGHCLSKFIRPDKLPPQRTTAILVQRLAIAMAEAHRHKVIHRDLKPANIMIDRSKQPIVMDFGLARELDAESQFTRSGLAVGTPAYMSPEQIRGELEDVGVHADIYALGVILYELLTGRLPFRGTIAKVVYKIVHEQPVPPSELRAGIDSQLESICTQMMAKDRVDRYQSMDEVASALSEILKEDRVANGSERPSDADDDAQTESTPSAAQPASETAALNAFFAARERSQSSNPEPAQASLSVSERRSPIGLQNESVPQVENAVPPHASRMRVSTRPITLAVGAALVGLLVFGAVWFLKAGSAVLRVELNDPSIQVSIQGQTLKFSDSGSEIRLRPSDANTLEISMAGARFVTESSFELVKGDNPAIRVSIVDDELVAKLGETELERWAVEGNAVPSNVTDVKHESGLTPFEILTSDDYEWSEPVFIGKPDTANNLDVALTDDITTWYADTKML